MWGRNNWGQVSGFVMGSKLGDDRDMSTLVGFSPAKGPMAPGLHLVATPIGTARDITLRALDVLAGADILAAEDTRTLRHLMEIHGIAVAGRPIYAIHDHNEGQVAHKVVAALAEGKSVAYASEAGTPLVSDPGFGLVRAAAAAGEKVHAVPGASAVLAALTVAGLPTDRFMFAGFIPSPKGERQRFLAELAPMQTTLVLYESPRRVHKTIEDMLTIFGADREAALCRELTKRHEEVIRGTVSEIAAAIDGRELKGEIVLVTNRAAPVVAGEEVIEKALQEALKTMSVRDAVSFVSQTLGVARKVVYQLALGLE